MTTFQVNDMSCGHCVSTITKAVKAADPAAQVSIDLATKRVEIASATQDAQAFKSAIEEAGYTPVEAGHGGS